MRLEQEQVSQINEIALSLGLPRNTVIRKLFAMVLSDVHAGRRIFSEPYWYKAPQIYKKSLINLKVLLCVIIESTPVSNWKP